jgi:mono/diheme cytochrome c family protein
MRLATAFGLGVLFLSGPVHGQQRGDPIGGRSLAARWCSGCHVIGPAPSRSATDAVPSFSSIARQPSTTPLTLRAYLRTSHPVMPNFALTDRQIDDVTAYIMSLRAASRR